jgi:hypothetical protein
MTQTMTAIDYVAAALRERHEMQCLDIITIIEACRQLVAKHRETPEATILAELLDGGRVWLCLFFVELAGQVIEHYADINVLYLNIPSSQLL